MRLPDIPEAASRQRVVSRRALVRTGFWTAVGTTLAAAGGFTLQAVYPRKVEGFGGKVNAGSLSQFPPGSKTQVIDGRFWLVNLTEEQGGPGLLALWWKCPHLGCTVPWREQFEFDNPFTGTRTRGWFRCPCHGSTYTHAGVRVWGPAPRSMDTMALSVVDGKVIVDTGRIKKGGLDNASRAVRV